MRKTVLKTVPVSKCNDTYLDYYRQTSLSALKNGIHIGQYCAQDPKNVSDSCQGDSGGPLQIFSEDSSIATIVYERIYIFINFFFKAMNLIQHLIVVPSFHMVQNVVQHIRVFTQEWHTS